MTTRAVSQVVPSVHALEGAGFPVRRPFPTHTLEMVDPFLLLDEMGPVTYPPGAAVGAPDHPHRGFETVTYLLAGRMQHRDSAGHSGALGPGDVQWMTAGSGIVHSEVPEPSFLAAGGRMHGFQLWVNLPARLKMTAPRYQDVPKARIPAVKSEDGTATVRVIAGSWGGQSSPVETHLPVLVLHVLLQPGARLAEKLPRSWNACAHVFSGHGLFGPRQTSAADGELVVYGRGADVLELAAAGSTALELLLLAAEPLGEPVARTGPFVMNTRAELFQAIEDYRAGRMGKIAG